MLSKEEVLSLQRNRENEYLEETEKLIDELITKAIQDGSLVGSYELSVPYTKTLKDKIIELVDKYKENLGGCVSIIHPIKFNDKTFFWKPTITIQLQSLFNS